ncbi:MAG: TlyA family RNA methyltransferase [Alphaproteobacteria bacterium]
MARLDQVLVARGLVASRARAQAEIAAGSVLVNGAAATKPSQKISDTDAVSLEVPAIPYVSRAGLKLAKALEVFDVKVAGKRALDLGASTGGFVEVLLAAGATHVTGVDVGQGQLHAKLVTDSRVTSLENTDARALTAELAGAPQIITSDMSFISLTKALQPALDLAAAGADLLALVKPQFEVGRKAVGRGGIVKDEALRQAALQNVRDWVNEQQGWQVIASADSPILGGDGNKEFLLHARKE